MALITAQTVTATGLTPTFGAVSASDTFAPDPNGQVYVVRNGGGSTDNVTFTDAGSTPSGNAGQSFTVAVPAGGERWIYVNQFLANPTTGLCTVTHSFTTSVTAALMRGV